MPASPALTALRQQRFFRVLRHDFPAKALDFALCVLLIPFYKIVGPPRYLFFPKAVNARLLRAFGARVGRNVRIYSPLTLHNFNTTYGNLVIADDCVLNGNIYLDLHERIELRQGASLGPGVIIMTHNAFNANPYLESRLSHMVGMKGVIVGRGSGIKAGALITMGVAIGENSVIGGNAVVNRDVADRQFVAGVPARLIREL